MKIDIPKGFFEDKRSVTPNEFLEMFVEMIEQVNKLEEELNYERETDFKYINENAELKKRIKELEAQIEKGGVAV
ncbi:MAG TPA: hypothetical protein GX707_10430 [Epulopiscium sp.]|nr:hypothetical protein [Candidatus Epulonipiscium sp.]